MTRLSWPVSSIKFPNSIQMIQLTVKSVFGEIGLEVVHNNASGRGPYLKRSVYHRYITVAREQFSDHNTSELKFLYFQQDIGREVVF